MKSNTQNAKIEAITEKTLVLGIDVGSETHYARAFDYRGIEYSKKPFKFSNTEAGFETFKEWILDLKERHEKDKVVPGMEPTGHYWFNLGKFLQDNEMKPVLVNPHHVKKTKELDDNNPTKNDRKDPKVIAGLVREGRYMIPYLPEGVYADLRTATNIRFQLQAELTRIQNRISRWFNIYFPEYKTVYGKPDAKSGMLILKAAPLPEDILTLGIDGVNQIWRDAKLRAVGKARAKNLIEAAEHSVGSKEGAVSARMEIRMLLEDYESRNTRLQEVMVLIEELVRKIPMAEKLLEIKGVGIRTVSGFLAEVGDISRFNNPKELQKLAGLALVENSSGKHKGETTISRRGRKRLRYLLFEVAMSLVSKNTWRFYMEQTSDRVLAYAIELTGKERGKIKGNLYELDYSKHYERVKEKELPADTVKLIYEHGEREIPAGQFFNGNPDYELGKFERFEAVPNDPDALQSLLQEERRSREQLPPGDFKAHIAALRDGLIETEARRIVREMKRHDTPNSPNKTHFMVELSPAFMQLAATKDTDRLFSMLPYKTLAFSKIEGRHGTYALIDKGENRDRKIRKPRPSIRAQLKADKAKTAPKKAAAKTKNHDMEV